MDARAALTFSFDSPGPETTGEIAALLGRSIGARGLAIGLVGPLGAGKTLFVKGLAMGLGVDPRVVSSPTFVIAQQYPLPEGPETLHHLDLYRLESEAALESIGFLDLLGPGQVVAVEWLDRFPDVLGPDRLVVELLPTPASRGGGEGEAFPEGDSAESVDAGRRTIRAMAFGDEAVRVLHDWSARWQRVVREDAAAMADEGVLREGAMLVVALVLAGVLGARALLGLPEPEAACASLVGVGADAAFEGLAVDALGDVAVACGAPFSTGELQRPLEGIARLLDGDRIDPNRAAPALLANLPGIGPGRAEAIAEARALRPFDSIRALERVSGIGPRTREKLEPFLAVDSEGPSG